MSKYDPLYRRLRAARANHLHLTFGQIERILGFDLPSTARERPQWWANERGNTRYVQSRAWFDAGFRTGNLDLSAETVDFERE